MSDTSEETGVVERSVEARAAGYPGQNFDDQRAAMDELAAKANAEAAGEAPPEPSAEATVEGAEEDAFDPADYNVTEVLDYAEAYPDQIQDIITAEEAGKARSTLLSQLHSMLGA